MQTSSTNTFAPGQISPHGNPSPINSASVTPANNSPTSPRLQHPHLHHVHPQSKQLRPLKSPLYVPAVLRPTERASRSSPLTPPRSVHDLSEDSNTRRPPSLSRQSTVESMRSEVSKLAEDEWLKDQNLGPVTGSPTREHWKADSASPSCDSPVCRSFFGLFNRRHHCRHCGHVFCSSHTPYLVPLDQNASFHPDGVPSRACDLCWSAYCRWDQSRIDQLNQIQRDLAAQLERSKNDGATSSLPKETDSDHASVGDAGFLSPSMDHQDSAVATSVPRDWSWSTF
ncbi:FYVE zinc finger domain containing protein [Coccidioides posadasii C735 delta SOWgp]|nr:FYVE zinc finger domain containing protein [Coccidioides posadasii C735 delta SOWgp]EER29770.1 FYVE zinc finger domain containing protein [Coccidioides posadasii C735 delta SOWgp]|eukprot:XP_003071915.1 FYVE zinc finger domain containing protein [Coccidioides posadasii C735 delta SOWgp]